MNKAHSSILVRQEGMHRRLGINVKQKARNIWYSYTQMQLLKHEQISCAGSMQLVKYEQIRWADRYRGMQLFKQGNWTHAQKRQAYMYKSS